MTAAAEPFPDDALTDDRLLGGRVRLLQPRTGYRAATDPVLLAAGVQTKAGERVLELGCGAGAALLCLAARVPGVRLAGLELQPAYLDLARRNAEGMAVTLHEGDVADPPAGLKALCFDHVMMNPPWHEASAWPAPDPGRDRAHRIRTPLATWIASGLRRLTPGGRLTLIQRAERLPECLAALTGPGGDIRVLPLAARTGRAAKRVLVTSRKGAKGPFRLLPALVLHQGERHSRDGDDFTPAARAILSEAAAIDWGAPP